jgi:hypothetical protein
MAGGPITLSGERVVPGRPGAGVTAVPATSAAALPGTTMSVAAIVRGEPLAAIPLARRMYATTAVVCAGESVPASSGGIVRWIRSVS